MKKRTATLIIFLTVFASLFGLATMAFYRCKTLVHVTTFGEGKAPEIVATCTCDETSSDKFPVCIIKVAPK